jgi:MFS transporter, LPLT family, lysophospholipid transporter
MVRSGVDERRRERGLVEQTLLEPTIPSGGALPPNVLTIRPFLWIVLGVAAGGFAFWGFLAAVFAQATFTFDATSADMALLGLSLSAPYALLIPFQGMIVDRWSPKWMNLTGYLALVAAVGAALAADSIGWLYASSFLVGVGFATIEPARSSLTGLLVDENRLVQANGTISAAFQISLMLGTLGGGFLTETVGTDAVYQVALGASVLAIVFNLIVPDVRQGGERPEIGMHDLVQGLRTAVRHPDLRLDLTITCLGWLAVTTFFVLEPLFIQDVLGQGESAVSFLWFTHGVGAMIGAVVVSRIRRPAGLELRLVAGGLTTAGVGLLVFSMTARYGLAFLGEALMGFGFSFIFAPTLALIQRVAGEDQRGRVTSIFGSLQETMGIASALVLLALGSVVVVQPTLVGAGLVVVAVGLLGMRAARRRASVAGEAAGAPGR